MPKRKNNDLTRLSPEELCALWQKDYVLAAYHILGVKLPVAQRAILRTWREASFMMIIASRGMGKSFNMAVGACLSACLNPGIRIGIIAPSYRQSKMVFDRIIRFWLTSPIFQDQCDKRPSIRMDSCYAGFKNGSCIEAIPLGQGDTIRGARYQEVIVDEWIHIPQEIMDEVILPMLNVPVDPISQLERGRKAYERSQAGKDPFDDGDVGSVNKIIMASTAYYRFHPSYQIYTNWLEISKQDPRYRILTMNYLSYPIYCFCKECKFATDKYPPLKSNNTLGCPNCEADQSKIRFESYMNMDIIHYQMANVPMETFMCENLSVWTDDSGGFFRASHVQKCTPPIGGQGAFYPHIAPVSGAKYVLGIDPGRERSNFALTILEVGRYMSRVVWCRGIGKEEFSRPDAYGEMQDLVRKLHRTFHFAAIGIDKGGGGSAIRDLLLRESTYVDVDGKLVVDPGLLEILGANNVHDQIANGERIIYMMNFTPAWINATAQSLRHALESKEILFPVPPRPTTWDGEAEEKCQIHEEIVKLADELVSIKTTVLPKLDSFLRFEAQSSTSKTDRAMSLFVAHHVASMVREKQIISERKPELATGGISISTGGSDIIPASNASFGELPQSSSRMPRGGNRAAKSKLAGIAALE